MIRLLPAMVLMAAATTALAQPADRETRFYVRAGMVFIAPLEISHEASLEAVDGPASLALSNGSIDGSGAQVDTVFTPGIIVGYVLPWWGGKVSVETILGLPFEMELKSRGTLAGESLAPEVLGIPTGVPALGTELGTARVAPPTVTAVYRFDRALGPIQPYAGGGLSVLIAYDERITNPVLTEIREPDFEIPPAPGLVLQAGAEMRLWGRLQAMLDVKFIAGQLVRGRVENIVVRAPELPLYEMVEVGTAHMNVWVNPLIIQAALGYDF